MGTAERVSCPLWGFGLFRGSRYDWDGIWEVLAFRGVSAVVVWWVTARLASWSAALFTGWASGPCVYWRIEIMGWVALHSDFMSLGRYANSSVAPATKLNCIVVTKKKTNLNLPVLGARQYATVLG